MRRALIGAAVIAALWACGGNTFQEPSSDGGTDGSSSGSGSSSGASSSGSGSSGGGSSSGSGGSSSSSGGSGSGSGGSSSSSGSGSSSGASSSSSGSGSSSGSSSGGGAPVNHRPDDSQCLQQAPAGDCTFGGSSGGAGMCSSDAQCADAGPEGRCIMNHGGAAFCLCTSDSCADDKACPTQQTCACHGSAYTNGDGNHCVPGNCRVDSDCGAGGWCSPTYATTGCGAIGGYYCHTPQDQCVNDSDCNDAGNIDVCTYDTNLGYWHCTMEVLCAAPKH